MATAAVKIKTWGERMLGHVAPGTRRVRGTERQMEIADNCCVNVRAKTV